MSKTASNERVRLGDRDFEILVALEKWGILGLGQLDGLVFKREAEIAERIKLFFNETSRDIYTKACYKRLADLQSGGYIRSHYYLNHPKLYTLSELGHQTLASAGKALLPGFRGSMSEALIRHEITVNAVGLVLSEVLGCRVSSERERLRWTGKGGRAPAPDARQAVADLWIIDREQPKAIEVELTKKSDARYKDIFCNYNRRMARGGVVLYLTTWDNGPEQILKLAKKYEGYLIYVASLREFREKNGACTFYSYLGDREAVFLTWAKGMPDPTTKQVPNIPAASAVPQLSPATPPKQRFRTAPTILPSLPRVETIPTPVSPPPEPIVRKFRSGTVILPNRPGEEALHAPATW